jgi:hypothetical protein
MFGWLFITNLLLVINGEPGQFALCHQRSMWLLCFCFPAVPHFNNRRSRVACSASRTSTATSCQHGTFNSHGGFFMKSTMQHRTALFLFRVPAPLYAKHRRGGKFCPKCSKF